MSRYFGVNISVSGTTVAGCVLNGVSTKTSAQETEARNEKGQVTDTWLYSSKKSISITGVMDAESLTNEAGSTIVFRGGTFGVNNTSVDENNQAPTGFSLEASRSDNATIHPISSNTVSPGTGT
ncbi:MAG: hypothetical protein IKQ16_02380 [Lentisphaeria bacterium]|nr:hypothetical protein [Lentisphaeria bacterium]